MVPDIKSKSAIVIMCVISKPHTEDLYSERKLEFLLTPVTFLTVGSTNL